MTTETRSPTANQQINWGWIDPTEAYASDNSYCHASRIGAHTRFYNYGFDGALPASISISKVEVGLEFYCSAGVDTIQVRVSVDNGANWSAWSDKFTLMVEAMLWVNVTAYKAAWTRDFMLDANWLVEIWYGKAGGGHGCPNKEAWTCFLDWIPTKVTYTVLVPAVGINIKDPMVLGFFGRPYVDWLEIERQHYLAYRAIKKQR